MSISICVPIRIHIYMSLFLDAFGGLRTSSEVFLIFSFCWLCFVLKLFPFFKGFWMSSEVFGGVLCFLKCFGFLLFLKVFGCLRRSSDVFGGF